MENGPENKTHRLVKSIGPSMSICSAGVFETGEIAQVEVLDESFGSWSLYVVDIVDVLHILGKKNMVGPYLICRDCRVYMVYIY